VGYNVYRGTAPAGPFSKINPAVNASMNYADNTVLSGQTYYYMTTAVDSAGVESSYSNQAQAVVPFP
jgi:fibronectin type 3 domain-containing protein